MEANTIVNFSTVQTGCQNCHLFPFCQPLENSPQERQLLGKIVVKIHQFERGDHLFRAHDTFKTVYVIRSGSAKTYSNILNGEEQVTGFHLAGKLLGLDAIGIGYHTQSAVALETCSICEIPIAKLEDASKDNLQLQHVLLYAMSKEIREDHYLLTILSRMPAAARLASFLLSLSCYFQHRGYSASNFNLSLSRHDIANLLGLAVETVSRLFTQFQEEGLLLVERKHIVLRNIDGLMKLSPSHCDPVQNNRVMHKGGDKTHQQDSTL